MIGSCVRLERGVRVGCGTMLGGFLTPVDMLPVVLEEEVIINGNCGVYGSVVVGAGSTLHPGTVLHSPSGAYDINEQQWLLPKKGEPLRIPAGSHVQMGMPPPSPPADPIPRLAPIIRRRDL